MQIILPVVFSLAAAVVGGIGALIRFKKAYSLISNYNMMSEEQKKNVDIAGLGKLCANTCFFIAVLLMADAVFSLLDKTFIMIAATLALIIPTVIYTLVKAQKYDGNAKDARGRMKKGSKIGIGVIAAFSVLLIVGVGILLYSGNRPAEYSVGNGVLSITDMYGQKVSLEDIKSVEIRDTVPEILLKTFGSDLGPMKKGSFKLKDIGKAKLFLDAGKPPFIYMQKNDGSYIILNCEESGKTKELYNQLRAEWEKK
jgi:hypothetical protein